MESGRSFAIVRFWQGIVSVGLRTAVLFLAILAFCTAAASVGIINDIDDHYRHDIINKDRSDRSVSIYGVEFPNTPGIVDGSRGACGWIILLCLLAFAYEPVIICLRCLNIGRINLYISVVLGIDIAFSSLFALGFLAGAISQAAYASGWWDWQDFLDDLEDVLGRELRDKFEDDHNLYFDRIAGAMGASAALSFLAMIVFITLVVWMILFLVFKWNRNMVSYTTLETTTVSTKSESISGL